MALVHWNGNELTERSLRQDCRGADVYLCCPGPSLKQVDPACLKVPGAMVFAINTAYPHVRPDVWVGGDLPDCYDERLYLEPFVKISPEQYRLSEIGPGRVVQDCPRTYFFESKRFIEGDRPEEIFETERLETDRPNLVWCKSTIWTALHLIVWMGARRIYLVGADFGGPRDYHDDRKLADHLRISNQRLMDRQVEDLAIAAEAAAGVGIEIISATEGSAANGVIRYVPLAEALEKTEAALPAPTGRKPVHAYLAEYSHWCDTGRILAPEGVVTGADKSTEWMLSWWYQNLMAHNPGIPVAFADFGMSPAMRERCEIDGIAVLDVGRKTRLGGWLNKPTAICMAPFQRVLWLDTDVEVRGDLTEVFALDGLAMAADGHSKADVGDRPVNSGVIKVDNGDERIVTWAREILANPITYRGDQEALNVLRADGRISGDSILPKRFNWLRLDGHRPAGAACVHHTGPAGHRRVAQLAGLLVDNFRGLVIAERLDALYGHAALFGAEIGVLTARTSKHLLLARENLTLAMVDIWAPPSDDSDYAQSGDTNAIRPAEAFEADYRLAESCTRFAEDRRHLMRMDSVEAAGKFDDGELDFVFIDGDHSFAGVMRDLVAWWPKVRPGGLISGHDIDNDAFPGFAVRQAIEAFIAERGIDVDMDVDRDFTWFIVKPGVGADEHETTAAGCGARHD